MTHATKINNEIKFVNLPDSFGEVSYGYKNRTDLHGKDGFYKIVKPTLNEGEMHLPLELSDFNDETFEAVYRVALIPEQTAQQLYDSLVDQGKIVFDEFRDLLAKASVNYILKGEVPQALKDLVVELETTKSNINQVLQLYLNYNNVAKLKAFRFDTPESEEFKNRIENFK